MNNPKLMIMFDAENVSQMEDRVKLMIYNAIVTELCNSIRILKNVSFIYQVHLGEYIKTTTSSQVPHRLCKEDFKEGLWTISASYPNFSLLYQKSQES